MNLDIDKIRRSVGIIGESEPMQEMLTIIGQVSNTDILVLITGNSGSGKEMAAKAIHKNSRRKFENLVTVNCAAIPSGIIESELFGHKKGSFTGANDNRKGYFESADKGTIFLDEIGELPLETQAKLLRVIEQGEFLRVGETKTKKVDVRIVAATNKDLADEVKKGNFRQDLYYRLKTVMIKVPSLCEHISDIYLYIERFGLEFTAKNDIPFKGFSSEAISAMKKHTWPGNIRELKNSVESLIVMNRGQRISEDMVKNHLSIDSFTSNPNVPVFLSDDSDKMERELILKQLLFLRQDVNELKQMLVGNNTSSENPIHPSNPALYLPPPSPSKFVKNNNPIDYNSNSSEIIEDKVLGELTMEEIEHKIIKKTLEKFKGNRRKTAQSLNISERTLYRKINDYGIKKKFSDQ